MGKKLAVGVGLLAVAFIGVYVLVNWKGLQTWYQLRELRQDPHHLARIVDSPEGTPEQAAVLRYIQRYDGARHLLQLYVSRLIEVAPQRAGTLKSAERGVLGYSPGNDQEVARVWASWGSGGSVASTTGAYHGTENDQLELLHRLVHEHRITDDEGFELPGHDGLFFQVLPAPWAFILTGLRNHRNHPDAIRSRDEDVYVCIARRKSGDRVLPPGPEAVPELLAALASEGAGWRALARRVLEQIGCEPDDPVPFVLRMIRQGQPNRIDDVALDALTVVDARHLPLLLAALEDDNPAVRHTVLLAVVRRDEAAETVIPAYLAAARDEEERIRGAAVYGLERLGTDAIPTLARLLASGPHRVRYRVLESVGKLGAAARPAIPAILAMIERVKVTGGNGLAKTAAATILRIEPGHQQAQDILRELEDEVASHPKDPTGPELTRTLARVEELKRQKNASELIRLAGAASAENRAVPTAAMRALGELGTDALPTLAEAVKGEDLNLGVAAVVRLRSLGAEAVPALIGALENPGISALAAGALGNFGAEAHQAVPHLEKKLDDSKPSFAAAVALLRIDPETVDLVVPKVLETFKSADKMIRDTQLRSLIDIIGKDLAPYLESERESENGSLRRAAQRGLELLEESAAGQ